MTIKLTKKLYRVTVYQVRKETVEIFIKLKYMVFFSFQKHYIHDLVCNSIEIYVHISVHIKFQVTFSVWSLFKIINS